MSGLEILTLDRVTKRYGNATVLDGITFSVKKGSIVALVGQNGAGKTTLMRVIASLTKPTGGKLTLFGESEAKKIKPLMKKLGCLIETPALQLNMTGPDNLEFYRIRRGLSGSGLVNRVLETVGLQHDRKKKVLNYSLGMKQRLGLAVCLLHGPEFLLLDEPANGLDPVGIVELRELIKDLNSKGITFIVSSHLISELTHIASDYVIIHRGSVLDCLSSGELANKCGKFTVFTVDSPEKARELLAQSFGFRNLEVASTNIVIRDEIDDVAEVNIRLTQAGFRVSSISHVSVSVEDYYVKLVKGAD